MNLLTKLLKHKTVAVVFVDDRVWGIFSTTEKANEAALSMVSQLKVLTPDVVEVKVYKVDYRADLQPVRYLRDTET